MCQRRWASQAPSPSKPGGSAQGTAEPRPCSRFRSISHHASHAVPAGAVTVTCSQPPSRSLEHSSGRGSHHSSISETQSARTARGAGDEALAPAGKRADEARQSEGQSPLAPQQLAEEKTTLTASQPPSTPVQLPPWPGLPSLPLSLPLSHIPSLIPEVRLAAANAEPAALPGGRTPSWRPCLRGRAEGRPRHPHLSSAVIIIIRVLQRLG